ncbi:tyrosyl-DNA phosphodiesterase 2 [Columba livia]|uniref:Tyrosyl-DNA phosphodiesterase 2 n=1 Tax=Columba livia TaxID=8932 RepID=A0A2I0MWZ6_COLLI|nr:tyrosyl-DNA phosphodiesterase 2 [Columba livia]PKK34201.1 tyrosyl-DNA phosphodiesterase 2 [Columba livia]
MEAVAMGRREEDKEGRCPQAGREPPLTAEKVKEENELHLAKRRKVLCSEFAAITSSDAAVARSFLADNDWHLQRALNAYFEPPLEEEKEEDVDVEKAGAGGVQPACPGPGSWIDLTGDATTSNADVNSADLKQKEDDSSFSLITWNIDGLDVGNLKERARGICSYLALYSPDVVFLQEVIQPHLRLLEMRASSYTVIPGNIDGYFTVIMLKKSRVKILKYEIIPFPSTSMMRNLLVVHVSISGNELCLMTSHLESTKDHSKERMKQLKIVLNKMQKESESTTVIFGGDTNLRDSEVAKLGSFPNNIMDIWEFLGKPQHCRYTWDTYSNTNLNAEYKCKLRFDRIYFRPAADGGHIIPRSMDLIGLEKLDCGRFPSDHWGLLCKFDVIL